MLRHGLLLLAQTLAVLAYPLQPIFTSCLDEYPSSVPPSGLLNVSQVFANLVPPAEAIDLGLVGDGRSVLRVNLLGTVGSEISGYSNVTDKLATLLTDTTAADVSAWTSTSWLCESIFPSSLPELYGPDNVTYCPLPAGDFGINVSIPLYHNYALTTLRTTIRVVDTTADANTLACYKIQFTPFDHTGWYYAVIRWFPVAIAIGYWLVTWSARFAAGWVVGSGMAEYDTKEGHAGPSVAVAKREARMRKWGTMIVSGLSGERFSVSGALLRFVTPGLQDIIHYIQFTTILGMISVDWPQFAYPIITRGAWADLVGNVTIVEGANSHPAVVPTNYTVPANFKSQMSNPYYPLYLDPTAPNPLLDLHGAESGMPSFALALGLHDQDLFGTCLTIFLALVGGVGILSLFIWLLHGLVEYMGTETRRPAYSRHQSTLGSSPAVSLGGKEVYEPRNHGWDGPALHSVPAQKSQSAGTSKLRKVWFRFRRKGEAGAFHAAALYGNLIRLILLFHLPITAFSIYQLTLSKASTVSRAFAGLAFVFISVLIPAFLMWRVHRTPGGKLYDASRTLLSLGPLYNEYVEGKQMFRVGPLLASLVEGIAIGAGQKSGLAQSVVILVVELAMLISGGAWYPWGEGASMGAPSSIIGIAKVVSVVLVMLLASQLSLPANVSDWIAYTVMLLQVIVFFFYLVILLTKIVEGIIRLSGAVHFDESTSPLDGGLFAAIMDLDCLNGVRGGKAAERRRRKRASAQLYKNVAAAGTLSTQMMLDRHSMGIPRQPESEGHSPFLSPYGQFQNQNYGRHMVGSQPPLGPAPQPNGRPSFEDDPSGNESIMDAWRPPSQQAGYPTPSGYIPPAGSPPPEETANKSFAVVRGGRADFENPYMVKDGEGSPSRSFSPPRGRLPPALSSSSHLTVPTVYGHGHQGSRPNQPNPRLSTLSIPKRPSLNDLKEDGSPTRGSPSPDSPRKKPRRGLAFFQRRNGTDSSAEESDDEPGPSRQVVRPFEAVPSPLGQKKGWKATLGIGKQDQVSEEKKDENKVRKDALAAESGSAFAGVNAPRKAFVVHRKGPTPGQAARQPPPNSRFGVNGGRNEMTGFAPVAASGSGSETGGGKNFSVKRISSARPNPTAVSHVPAETSATQGRLSGPPTPLLADSPTFQPPPGPSTTSRDMRTRNEDKQAGTSSSRASVQSTSAGVKRTSNVIKSPTGARGEKIKSPTSPPGPGGKRKSAGGLWGDLEEFGAGASTSKVASTSSNERKNLISPTSRGTNNAPRQSSQLSLSPPIAQTGDSSKSFKVLRPKAYQPPATVPDPTPAPAPSRSFLVNRGTRENGSPRFSNLNPAASASQPAFHPDGDYQEPMGSGPMSLGAPVSGSSNPAASAWGGYGQGQIMPDRGLSAENVSNRPGGSRESLDRFRTSFETPERPPKNPRRASQDSSRSGL